jgi:hypothetical protein
MNAAVNRRVFVGSVAASLPVLAAYGFAATPPARADAHAPAGAALDPMFDHVVHELAVIHNRGTERGFTGEDARAIAAQLRTAAIRGRQIDLDAAARAGLDRLIRRRGRHAVLAIDVDRAKTKAQLKRYGIEVGDRWLAANPPDHATRTRALDALISGGVTDVLTHSARVFDKVGSVLDARASVIARVRHAQGDPMWWSFCWGLLTEIMMLWAQVGPVCEATGVVPGLDVVCPALEAALSAYYEIYYAYCA